ncbi:MAG: hypothetical protein ACREFP_23710 [Acetobacteraceae bacterium]
MAQFQLSEPAKADISAILRRGEELNGSDAVRCNRSGPAFNGPLDRGIRSFHTWHRRDESRKAPVADPVHMLFSRVTGPGVVEIVRVLHDRIEPRQHIVGGREATE